MKIEFALTISVALISFTSFNLFSNRLPLTENKVNSDQYLSVYSTAILTRKEHADTVQPIYSDTRTGTSSPLYNSYKKNDDGAGSITTNDNKLQSGSAYKKMPSPANSVSNSPIYRDTRLGSSSPLYNTYKKNDYGAGAITTNPNKS
ncbi:MAG: hypothetical protein Q8891_11990 [Bacteroidota bacterium]|nr:hypothetical protein [Bacteroidota bacterium]